jgi:radical SAM superfamily enzyme YgiQ (UPF0313 family)
MAKIKILYKTDQYSQQRQREKPVWVYPVHMAMEATKDLQEGHEVHWNDGGNLEVYYDEVVTKPGRYDFLSLPIPDRKFTGAFDRRYQLYGNYKFHPATHMMVAGGCWHGKCTFCVESRNRYQVRPIDAVLGEIAQCDAMGFKEIFDDSATFPQGPGKDGCWLEIFCHEKKKQFPEIVMGCNLRVNMYPGTTSDFYNLKKANFRMVLIGVESANQSTLDRIKKGIKADDIIPFFKRAADAGLEAHAACMFGYPWESAAEELKTLDLVHTLLKKGWAKTAQASLYDVKGETAIDRGTVSKIYNVAFSPEFWINKLRDIRRLEDFIYLIKGIRKGLVHD